VGHNLIFAPSAAREAPWTHRLGAAPLALMWKVSFLWPVWRCH